MRAAIVLIAALVLSGLNLRPGLASIGPLEPAIRRGLGLSRGEVGLLTTIPAFCFGVFAPIAPRVARRFGNEATLAVAIAVIGAMTAARLAGGVVPALFAATTMLGVAIAIAQTLLPAIVKSRFPRHAVLATGAYALSINLGALLAASLAAPVAAALGGSWQASLAIWSLLAPGAVLAWRMVRRGSTARRDNAPAGEVPTRMPLRSRAAWALTAYMGGLSLLYVVTLAWLAPLYHRHGLTVSEAGLILSLFAAAQIASGMLGPPLVHRFGSSGHWLAGSVAAVGVGMAGFAAAPMTAPVVWSTVSGLGMGLAYPLVLALFVERARSPAEAGGLTAMGFGGGYLLACAGPYLAGVASDQSGGSLAGPFAALALVAVVMTILTPALVRGDGEPFSRRSSGART